MNRATVAKAIAPGSKVIDAASEPKLANAANDSTNTPWTTQKIP